MKRKYKNDLLLIGVILAVALVGFGVFSLLQSKGKMVSVQINGVETARYELSQNIEVPIVSGASNEQHNVLKISDGEATVISADCPDGICVNHKPISNVGETIVCLPHKVVIIIE